MSTGSHNELDQVIARFLTELEAAADKQIVLEQYCQRHPQWPISSATSQASQHVEHFGRGLGAVPARAARRFPHPSRNRRRPGPGL